MVDTTVSLATLTLKNPIIPASGTFGFGREMAKLYDLNILGGIAVKGTTKDPRFGNPTPRIAEAPSGIINAVGLQNPGIETVITEELPALRNVFDGVIFANISGFCVQDYVFCAEKIEACPQADAIELNISCPNVHGGGMAFGTNCHEAESVVNAVRKVTKKPLFVKLSPNVTSITEIARACEAAGADGLSLINTISAMRIDLNTKKPILANLSGGLSGPAILPVAVKMVYDTYHAVKIPLIGMGGISCAQDVLEFILAGARAVQIGAANLVDPFASKTIAQDLAQTMENYHIQSLQTLCGGAH